MLKTYFVTVSWQKDQLSRAHKNEKVELDLKDKRGMENCTNCLCGDVWQMGKFERGFYNRLYDGD